MTREELMKEFNSTSMKFMKEAGTKPDSFHFAMADYMTSCCQLIAAALVSTVSMNTDMKTWDELTKEGVKVALRNIELQSQLFLQELKNKKGK